MTKTDPTKLHPLAEALGSDWRWLLDSARRTVVILHPSGLFVEVDRSFLAPGRIDVEESRAIGAALRMGVLEGRRGEVSLCVHRSETVASARLVAPLSKRASLGARSIA
jgi:hypothetical protein